MEHLRHRSFDDPDFQEAFLLYRESFPPHEQRGAIDQKNAMADPAYHCESIWEDGRFCGLLFYWELGGYSYVEHFAIHPALRGGGAGSRCLKAFCVRQGNVILEIDPPEDERSIRRQGFYERLGFHANPYPYRHPAYQKAYPPHPLVIMSWPEPIGQEQFGRFVQELTETVMRYSFSE